MVIISSRNYLWMVNWGVYAVTTLLGFVMLVVSVVKVFRKKMK